MKESIVTAVARTVKKKRPFADTLQAEISRTVVAFVRAGAVDAEEGEQVHRAVARALKQEGFRGIICPSPQPLHPVHRN